MTNPYSPTTQGGMPQQKPIYGSPRKWNVLSIVSISLGGASLVVGTLGFCICGIFAVILIPLPIAAIVCGFMGLRQIRRNNEQGDGLCYGGIAMGGVCLVLMALLGLLAIIFISILQAGPNGPQF